MITRIKATLPLADYTAGVFVPLVPISGYLIRRILVRWGGQTVPGILALYEADAGLQTLTDDLMAGGEILPPTAIGVPPALNRPSANIIPAQPLAGVAWPATATAARVIYAHFTAGVGDVATAPGVALYLDNG